MPELGFDVRVNIPQPVEEVFEAVVNPKFLSDYFTTSASGRLETGKTITWIWNTEECDAKTEVQVEQVVPNKSIEFTWEAYKVGYDTKVSFQFENIPAGTKLTIRESGWKNDDEGRSSSYEHCSGWTHMLLCLKGRIQHGIDLRN